MTKHYPISPSAIDRLASCPGSFALTKDLPRESSDYALEGSAAHAAAEAALRLDLAPDDLVGEFVDVDHTDVIINQEMADAATVYVDYVRSLDADLPHIETTIESVDTPNNFGGTPDFFGVLSKDEAIIVDFKFGRGVTVAASNNRQLLAYAALVRDYLSLRFNTTVPKVRAVIIQPRAQDGEPIKEATFSRDLIIDFKKLIATVDHWLTEAVQRHEAGQSLEGLLTSGDHCRFCQAKPFCPQLQKENAEALRIDFADSPLFDDDPTKLSRERTVEILRVSKQIRDWLDAVESHALARAQEGEKFDDFKLIQTFTRRRWTIDEVDVVKRFRGKLKKADLLESKLKSPSQIEKLLPKEHRPIVKEIAQTFPASTKLVPIEDRRREIADAKSDFAEGE